MITEATRSPALTTVGLGHGGPIVSRLGLGTMTFGVETSEEAAHRQLDTFVDAGGTFLDTADVYGNGASEQIIGRWAKRRGGIGDLILATKGRFGPPAGSYGASRRSLVRSVDASLGRLGVEAIDLYFVHGWDDDTPVAETLDTLTALVHAGKIHHVGWSNVTGWQLQHIIDTADRGGFVRPVALQPQYSLLDRHIEVEVLPCCLANGLSVTPWSPLGGGWLTGKYRRDARPTGETRLGENPDRGVEAYDIRNTDRTWKIVDHVAAVADEIGRSMTHVALAWLAARPAVGSILIGARTVDQLVDNLTAADLVLDDALLDRLTAASNPGLPPYPYGMLEDFCDIAVWKHLGIRPS